jgi:hypothetical protein
MKCTVESVFKEWIAFMNERGPMGENGLRTEQFRELRDKIKAEIALLEEDDENFNCGAMS